MRNSDDMRGVGDAHLIGQKGGSINIQASRITHLLLISSVFLGGVRKECSRASG